MSEEGGKFEITLRVLGNELVGFTMLVDDFKTKWLVLGLATIIVLTALTANFGPEIAQLIDGETNGQHSEPENP